MVFWPLISTLFQQLCFIYSEIKKRKQRISLSLYTIWYSSSLFLEFWNFVDLFGGFKWKSFGQAILVVAKDSILNLNLVIILIFMLFFNWSPKLMLYLGKYWILSWRVESLVWLSSLMILDDIYVYWAVILNFSRLFLLVLQLESLVKMV